MEKKNIAYRLPPCHSCDVERAERWLGDMARQGLVLDGIDTYRGLFRFRREEPRAVEYRLFSGWQAPSLRMIWKKRTTPPSREEQDFHAAFGWTYVTRWDWFSVYARTEGEGRELHTDPAVQAIDIAAVSQWIKWREIALSGALTVLLVLCWVFPARADWASFFFVVAESFWSLVVVGAILVLCFGWSAHKLWSLRRLRKKLRLGQPMDRDRDWRAQGRLFRGVCILLNLLLVVCALSLFLVRTEDPIRQGEYPGDLPFPMVEEMIPEGTFTPDPDARTMYSEGGSVFYPTHLHIWEEGSLVLPDGSSQTVYLRVDYYEARSPAMAETIAQCLLDRDRSYEHLTYQELPSLDLGVEEEVLYRAGDWGTDLLLRNGNQVIQSCLYQEGGDAISLEAWATQLAEAIR